MKKDNFNLGFPMVRNISPKLLSDDIKSMTAEETRETMQEMFNEFEQKTGFKPIIVGDSLPTKILFPKENTKSTEE